MNRGWKKSGLYIGEELKFPEEFFESHDAKYRLLSARFVQETDNGILIEFEFLALLGNNEKIKYKSFIDWSKIWSGMKIQRVDGTLVRAERIEDHPALKIS